MDKLLTFRGACAQLDITDDVCNDSDENEEELIENEDTSLESPVDEENILRLLMMNYNN